MGERAVAPRAVRRLAAEGGVDWHIAVTTEGRPCLLARGRERAILEKCLAAHSVVRASECPAPLASDLDGEHPWMALDCDPVGTLEDLCLLWPKRSVPYAEAIVLSHTIARSLHAAHAVGVCLGALAPSQVVVDRSGTFKIVGFGLDESGWGHRVLCAPTVAMGAKPTPSSDVHMGLLFLRAHIHWVADVPPALGRLLHGDPGPIERAFGRVLFGVLTQTGRLDGTSALRGLERFWSIVGVSPARDAMGRRLRATFDDVRVRLDVARDYSWMSVDDGPRHDLARREPVRRVLRALVEAAGKSLSVDELVVSAWPGEVLVGSSGADRLYVALSTLRKLDLRAAIERDPNGYLLRAATSFRDV